MVLFFNSLKLQSSVFMIVSFNSLKVRFMRQMTTEKLFDEGRYMVIYLYPEVSDRMVGAGTWK